MLCIQRNGMYALKSIQKKKKSRLCWRKTFSLTQWLWISFDSSRISFNESPSLQFSAVVVKRLNYISDTILIKFAALKILCLMVYVKLGWLSYCQCGEVIQKIGTRGNNRSLKKDFLEKRYLKYKILFYYMSLNNNMILFKNIFCSHFILNGYM